MDRIKDFRRTILVVDDEAVNREMLNEILSQHYEVIQAENGTEALSVLRARFLSCSLTFSGRRLTATLSWKQ